MPKPDPHHAAACHHEIGQPNVPVAQPRGVHSAQSSQRRGKQAGVPLPQWPADDARREKQEEAAVRAVPRKLKPWRIGPLRRQTQDVVHWQGNVHVNGDESKASVVSHALHAAQ